MTDIKQALKEKIKGLKSELAANEKALAALEGDKATRPKASAAKPPTESGTTSGKKADGAPLPERIVSHLSGPDAVRLDAAALASQLKAEIGQVRTTCSRLVREGRLFMSKVGRSAFYSATKESETADSNPFEGEAN